MKKIAPLLLLLLCTAPVFTNTGPLSGQKALVFTNVTVIDATGAAEKPRQTVVIVGDLIIALGGSDSIEAPKSAQVIDARGKYLIPGLWDMHAHVGHRNFLTLLIANGITGVRDMGSAPEEFEQFREWQEQIEKGTLQGPRIVSSAIVLDGPKRIGRPGSMYAESADEGREAVRLLRRRGAVFVKVYSMLSKETYFAIADEAKKQGMAFAGHLPFSLSAEEAADAGQKSFEHLFGVLAACSTEEAKLKREAMAEVEKTGIAGFVSAEIGSQVKALDTFNDARAAALFARFRENGTWQVPTLAGWANVALSSEGRIKKDERFKYVTVEKREAWEAQKAALLRSLPPIYSANSKRLFQKQLELVGLMHRAGVGILAGTDTSAYYLVPGFSLHNELVQLVKAGLTPMEALQSATRNVAMYLGRLDSQGTVEKGKLADLVLLEASPLEDISNTQKIAAVVLGGKLIPKSELQAMLRKVAAESSARPDRSANGSAINK